MYLDKFRHPSEPLKVAHQRRTRKPLGADRREREVASGVVQRNVDTVRDQDSQLGCYLHGSRHSRCGRPCFSGWTGGINRLGALYPAKSNIANPLTRRGGATAEQRLEPIG